MNKKDEVSCKVSGRDQNPSIVLLLYVSSYTRGIETRKIGPVTKLCRITTNAKKYTV
jgi:hypothetical protein